jgi:chemosensory pili system protein ChpA (sensor histidine kinase/response regulator)
MMDYPILSHLAHRLEDNFKVVKTNPAEHLDQTLEQLLLAGVDHLRQVANGYRSEQTLDEGWLGQTVHPTFDKLYDRLGDPTAEDSASLLSEEMGTDIALMLFESEVEGTLTRLEAVLAEPDPKCLKEEFAIAAQELAGLGEMLDLPTFVTLCHSIETHLEAADNLRNLQAIAQQAQQTLRQAQAMVLIGQRALIPDALILDPNGDTVTLDLNAPVLDLGMGAIAQDAVIDLDIDAAAQDLDFLQTLDLGVAPDLSGFDSFPELVIPEALTPEADLDSPDIQIPSTPDSEFETLDLDAIQLDANALLSSLTELEAAPSPEPSILDTEPISQAKPQRQTPPPLPTTTPKKSTTTARPQPLVGATPAADEDQTLRVSVRQLNQLNELFGELITERNGLALYLKRIRELTELLTQRVHTLEQSNSQLRSAYDKVATETTPTQGNGTSAAELLPGQPWQPFASDFAQSFDLLEMDRYSELHSFSQELMETAVQIQETTADLNTNLQDAEQTTRELTRTTKQLQVGMTQLRMRPVSDVVSRYPRVLRDWALQYGKEVDLKIVGASTLIDRSILDALSDPLIHILRNAYDHGIEDPQQRLAAGKSPKGRIEVTATYRGNQTLITIQDDGAGISLEKIKSKAIKMGLDADVLATASESQLLDLIFEPGFSTAATITELSGRGVGMDIVRTNLQKVGGTITVSTQAGLGTTFVIAVPFTLSVLRVLLVESGHLTFAFPTDAVEEVRLLNPTEILEQNGRATLQWEDLEVPIIPLNQWLRSHRPLQFTDHEAVPIINEPTLLVIGMDDQAFALKTDRYWGEQEVTIRQVEGDIPLPTGFAGCTVLGDGRIAPLVDPIALLNHIAEQQTTPPAQGESGEAIAPPSPLENRTQQPTILVVDDSVNVRRFMALTLSKAGFRVEQAKDGQDALEKLQLDLPIQAIVCDIEMPRLDGFGFLAHLKADVLKRHLPVVMLTSRSGDKHRRLALSLGASAYFSKPFQEQDLIATLKQLQSQSLFSP